MYGTRGAAAVWDATCTKVLRDLGSQHGTASPCCFRHEAWGIVLVVHGDDFTALGTDTCLDLYEEAWPRQLIVS